MIRHNRVLRIKEKKKMFTTIIGVMNSSVRDWLGL